MRSLYRQNLPILLPKYTCRLNGGDSHISYLSTEYGIYFGGVTIENSPNIMLIFGPVNITPYSDSELHQMNMDYMVPRESRQEFSDFFQRVPQYSLAGFLIKLTFINYCINGEMLDPQKLLPKTHIEGTSSEKWYENKHNSLHNNSHEIETVILDIIRSGKPEHITQVEFNESLANPGVIGPHCTPPDKEQYHRKYHTCHPCGYRRRAGYRHCLSALRYVHPDSRVTVQS